jgi:hypothetical protein
LLASIDQHTSSFAKVCLISFFTPKVIAKTVRDWRQRPQIRGHPIRFNVVDGRQHSLFAVHKHVREG